MNEWNLINAVLYMNILLDELDEFQKQTWLNRLPCCELQKFE